MPQPYNPPSHNPGPYAYQNAPPVEANPYYTPTGYGGSFETPYQQSQSSSSYAAVRDVKFIFAK